MNLRRRLHRLTQASPPAALLKDDREYQNWRCFYEVALEVLAPFPEARQLVETRVGVNEPHTFKPGWQPSVNGIDYRFWLCKETLWGALMDFPDAREALEKFVRWFERARQSAEKGPSCV
jgi:hypothetical protein